METGMITKYGNHIKKEQINSLDEFWEYITNNNNKQ